jgi:hypothetical protein
VTPELPQTVGDYQITQDDTGAYVAALFGELTDVERRFGVRTRLAAESLSELLVVVGLEMGRRETIRLAGELADRRLADERAEM